MTTQPASSSAPEAPITLNVKTLESQTYAVSVPLSETVLQLKDRLASLLEVPSPRQRLIFRGRVLANEKPLTDYSLQDGHTIHLVTRPADAPSNQQNDTPQSSTRSAAGSGPLRFDTRDYHFSIINVDEHADPHNIMQALAGALPLDMEFDSPPTVLHLGGDPPTIRSLFAAANDGSPPDHGGSAAPTTADARASRLRALFNAPRSVPLGASLPHLATIEAELTRVSTQLRNVQTILSHPADQLEGVELEPLDVPDLESLDEEVDGDSTDLRRMGSILTQLSETSRTMANHLQTLSDQFNQTLGHPSDHLNLQRVSLRAARAMYRLASVQNTVFPMLANATFVGTNPGPVTYRYQPAARMTAAHMEAPSAPTTRNSDGRTGALPRNAILQTFPFPALTRGSGLARGSGASAVPLGLIPSIMAHARASAQTVNAAAAAAAAANASNSSAPSTASASTSATSTTSPRTTTTGASDATAPTPLPQPGSGPIGQMVLGPNGSLSYSIQPPPRSSSRTSGTVPSYAAAAAAAANPFASRQDHASAARFMIPADFAGAGFMDFWRNMSGQTSPTTRSTASGNNNPASDETTSTAAGASGLSESETAAMRAVRNASDQLEQLMDVSLTSRRRERPEDFAQDAEGRASTRRRLTDQMTSVAVDLEGRMQELDVLLRNRLAALNTPSAPSGSSGQNNGTTTPAATSRPQPSSRPVAVARSSSNDSRRPQVPGASADSSSPVSSPSPSSPSNPSSSNGNGSSGSSSNSSPAYNLGRIGVFISALLRMVDQPREDGSPRTLADVICNDPESSCTPLQDLVRNVAESLTVRETRSIVEGHPAPLRNIHPTLNSFIRGRALNGQQPTESNLESVAVSFAYAIMNAVNVEEYLETLSPPASIQISSAHIRRISVDVLQEHFRRLIYLVVAAPVGRESNWPTFARDLILWIRDVVGAWRVAFYGLFQERDQAEAQRIATHVVGSAIHANGRRWVELSNRATNTLVNVLCANIVPRRRGEEQTGGLVGGAWPLMATGPPQNSSRSRTCMAPSLLGSTAHPLPLGPSALFGSNGNASASASSSSQPVPGATSAVEAETLSENLARRIRDMMAPLGVNVAGAEALVTSSIREAVLAELSAIRAPVVTPASSSSSSSSSSSGSTAVASLSISASNSNTTPVATDTTTSDESTVKPKSGTSAESHRTRVEDGDDEDMS
ncbi:hypothetical protein BGZ72_004196 [Mortierella alpina]|nr:hypothetical protein BGZ72_004196 [Mortierella alpina]